MNLFDMTNPKKAEEAKILEAKQELVKHPEKWNKCEACGRAINPMLEGNIDDHHYCLDCYCEKRGKRNEPQN